MDKSREEYKWKISILNSKSKDVYVGVAPNDFDIYFKTMNHENCGWYFHCSDATLYSGPPFKYSCYKTNLSKVKDDIVIVMNMKKRSLKFIINNEDKGDSYADIPFDKPLYPAVLLIRQGDSVEISDFA